MKDSFVAKFIGLGNEIFVRLGSGQIFISVAEETIFHLFKHDMSFLKLRFF